ncbi:hypothetical protein LTR85_009628 [Meristemomyces frigidus]|nr:hypothetical protein LTR85_009628 [Meristemomyces frigidus]
MDGSRISTSLVRLRKNAWDAQQRTGESLHLLYTQFEYDLAQITAIFNEMYKDHLAACNIFSGLPATTVKAQYSSTERKRKPGIWESICAEPPSVEERHLRNRLIKRIKEVAATLRQRQSDNPAVDSPAVPDTLGVITRKRNRTAARNVTSDAGGDTDQPTRPTKRSTNAVVLLSRPATLSRLTTTARTLPTPPKTPRTPRTPRSPGARRPAATIRYTLEDGTSMNLTPQEFERTKKDLVPVLEAAAHPASSALLFRYWDENSQSKLIRGQFKAGKYRTANIPPGPLPELDSKYFPWTEICSHLNRDLTRSPFISTSNHLCWILRLAAKEASRGVTGGQVTIIDAAALESRNVYHVPPFHKTLCAKRPFTKGAQRYHGSHEFMVYHKIPSSAVVSTFAVQELLGLSRTVPALGNVLRFNVLTMAGDYRKKLRRMLREDDVQLKPEIVSAMARLCRFMGLSTQTPMSQISHVVSDIVQGWAFHVLYASPEEWPQVAAIFAHVYCRRSTPAAGVREVQKVKVAFLDGVKWGLGTFNARHTAENILKMQKKADAVGLGRPAKLIADELDAAKLDILTYEKAEDRLIGNVDRTPPLLLDDTATPGPSSRRTWRAAASGSSMGRTTRVMVYDEDETEELGDDDDGELDEQDEIRYK